MGCFLACFGFEGKKKQRKSGKKTPSQLLQHDNQTCVLLDYHVDIEQNPTSDSSQIKEKPSIVKPKKKVRFNLNVTAYQPIPDGDDDEAIYLSGDENEAKFDACEEGDAMAPSYPASYRYQNCRDSDDEDEDLGLDSDLDEIEECDEEADDVRSNNSDDWWALSDNDATKNRQEQTSLIDLIESKSNARDRSQYVSSVLNPVENLSQWKVVKAKTAMKQLRLQKENKQNENSLTSMMNPYSELILTDSDCSGHHHPVAVDASLTNWLSSLETRPAYLVSQHK